MTNSRAYVSKSAAARILSKDPQITKLGTIHSVKELKNVVVVVYNNNRKRCSTFIGYKKFQQDFINLRVEGAKKPCDIQTLNRVSGSYLVQMHSSDRAYCVTVNAHGYACTCEDFQGQLDNGNGFTRAICKHPLAVAYSLGYGSLNECLKVIRAQAAA